MLTALSRLMKTQGQVLSSFHKYDESLATGKILFCCLWEYNMLVFSLRFHVPDEQYYYLMLCSLYSENQCLHVHICIFKFYVMQ